MRRFIVFLSVLTLSSVALSFQDSAVAAKVKKLRAEFQAAQTKFFTDYEKIKDPKAQGEFYTKRNPAAAFLGRALNLARTAGKDPAGASAYDMAFMLVGQVPNRQKDMLTIAKEAVDKYGATPGIKPLLGQLAYSSLGRVEAKKLLERVRTVNPNDGVKAAATATLARIYKGWGSPKPEDEKQARIYLNEIITRYPKSEFVASAKGDLYELDNLGIGKTFPDFDARDEKDVPWKLSDYRGKVVVLDFWGFW